MLSSRITRLQSQRTQGRASNLRKSSLHSSQVTSCHPPCGITRCQSSTSRAASPRAIRTELIHTAGIYNTVSLCSWRRSSSNQIQLVTYIHQQSRSGLNQDYSTAHPSRKKFIHHRMTAHRDSAPIRRRRKAETGERVGLLLGRTKHAAGRLQRKHAWPVIGPRE